MPNLKITFDLLGLNMHSKLGTPLPTHNKKMLREDITDIKTMIAFDNTHTNRGKLGHSNIYYIVHTVTEDEYGTLTK